MTDDEKTCVMSDRSVLLAARPKKCNPPNSTKSCLPSTKGDVATAVSESALTDCSHRLLELLAWRSKIVPTVSAASTSALAKPGAGRQRWQSLAHRLACSSYLPSRSGLRSGLRHQAPDFALALLRPVPAMWIV